MFRRSIAAAVFIWAMIVISQPSNAQTAPGTVASPAISGNTVLLGNGPTTPNTTFAAPAPTAGISDAGRAGISNSAPLSNNVVPAPNDTVVYYSQPGTQPVVTTPSANESVASGTTTAVTAPPENSPNAPEENPASSESGGRTFNDLGPSYYSQAMANPDRVSLGRLAAQYKAAKSATNAKTLTNQDVEQMLSNKTGVTTAKNMPPLGPSAMPSGLTQSSASSTSQPQSAPSSASAAQSSTAASGQAQSGTAVQQTTPPPANTTQPAGSTATAGTATTPQINPNQQSNDAQGKSKLPATATFLPLLGLLGLMSGGIGLWFRKFRK
ncbi:MAG TPA: hypothetical protein VJW20_05160 [Candidatus Angelobacter sp.]|nr:hypothetical protein [Candidatus Angelobacter sp.]